MNYINQNYFKRCIHGVWEKSCIYCWKKNQTKTNNELMDMGSCPECGSNHTSDKQKVFECKDCGFTATIN